MLLEKYYTRTFIDYKYDEINLTHNVAMSEEVI
jgi:hypothetical protein